MPKPNQDKDEPAQHAVLHSPSEATNPRRGPGTLQGKIHLAPDFDVLPPDVLAAMEDGKD